MNEIRFGAANLWVLFNLNDFELYALRREWWRVPNGHGTCGVRGTFKYAFDYSFNGEHDGNKQKLKYAQTKIEIN